MNVNEMLQPKDRTGHADGRVYKSLVRGLNYLPHTRPAIAFPMSVMSKYMHNPTKQHFGAAKKILRYVAGSLNFGVLYTKVPEENFRLVRFTNSDCTGCLDDLSHRDTRRASLGSKTTRFSESHRYEATSLSIICFLGTSPPRVSVRSKGRFSLGRSGFFCISPIRNLTSRVVFSIH
ncbi:hypothetical protein RND81_09G082400 [Saponaria officinalis]|uniref:Uncharacterized protein n=1 Tax=Saponaria officinalis TaxID=3572 RepID=A0AAW1IJZ2_SAPOF